MTLYSFLKQEIVGPLCRDIETDLRLHVHSTYLKGSVVVNPTKVIEVYKMYIIIFVAIFIFIFWLLIFVVCVFLLDWCAESFLVLTDQTFATPFQVD